MYSRNSMAIRCITIIFLAGLLALGLPPLSPPAAISASGDVELASCTDVGVRANNPCTYPSISEDGRFVVFQSTSGNLVPGVGGQQIYRKDLELGDVQLVSCSAGGVQGNGQSSSAVVSADGKNVVFQSNSTNLIPPVPPAIMQIYMKNMDTGEIVVASKDAAGNLGNGACFEPCLTPDGRYVGFGSVATNLVSPASSGQQMFRKDLATGDVKLVSCDSSGNQGNDNSLSISLTPDGRYAAFSSSSSNLVSQVTANQQMFRKDLQTGEVKLISCNSAGIQGNSGCGGVPQISRDGRFNVFASLSTDLVEPATSFWQVFEKDLQDGSIKVVSTDIYGNVGNSSSGYFGYAMSSDARYAVFSSAATDLVPTATSGWQVFRKDLYTGGIVLCSSSASAAQGNHDSEHCSITPDGRYVAFDSDATNLIAPATANYFNVFRKELNVPFSLYFAEGYTGSGFQEYLCLVTPGIVEAPVYITYLFNDGTSIVKRYAIPPETRITVNVNADVGSDKDVAVQMDSEQPFFVERPMYFDYTGGGSHWTGGSDARGAAAANNYWYFAEGYTGPGFDEWICVLNPTETQADLTFQFQTQEEGLKTVDGYSVPAHSRRTFKANQLLDGKSYQTSLRLAASRPVVAERPMYFNYQGTNAWNWTGGHCVMGANDLSTDYYFAEGTTRAGFEEWLTLVDPGIVPMTVHATYELGSGSPIEKDYGLEPGKRTTVYVANEVGLDKDVSVHLSSALPFLAERPMYFNYQGMGGWNWTGGHCVIGATQASISWTFAEGYTGPNFEEWLCIQNPNPVPASILILYYTTGGAPTTRQHIVPPSSRYTILVNSDVGSDFFLSARIASMQNVIVERPMYFNYNGVWTGGHDMVGF